MSAGLLGDKLDKNYMVGGTHYKVPVEHWDWMIAIGLGEHYLIGQVTKYLSRWRKKGTPAQDLEKSMHYLLKFIENTPLFAPEGLEVFAVEPEDRAELARETAKFVEANGLTSEEASICMALLVWKVDGGIPLLLEARDTLLQIMEQYDRANVPAKPVPASDSNKHASYAEFDDSGSAF